MRRTAWIRALLVAVGALASCFPSYGIEHGSGGDAGDASSGSSSGSTGSSSGSSSGGDAGDSGAAQDSSPPFDGGSLMNVPSCGDVSGLQPNAPWPMHGYCPAQRRRSPLPGPGPTPSVKWSKLVHPDAQFEPLVAANGYVLVASTSSSAGTGNSALRAYDPGGGLKWTWSPPASDDIQWSPAIGADDVVYVPCTNRVYGVGVLDGATKWTSADAYGTRSSLAVGPGPVLYVDDPTSDLWSLASDGGRRWAAKFPITVDSEMPMFGVADAGLTLYQAGTDGTLWTLSSGGGSPTKIWDGSAAMPTPNSLRVIAAPDGNLRVSNETDDSVTSLTAAGSVAWVWTLGDAGDPGPPRVPAVDDQGTTFIGHGGGGPHGGNVVAIDALGSQKWTTDNTETTAPLCNSVTLDSNGVPYSGCDSGLHAYQAGNGYPWWEFNPNANADTGFDYGISIGRNQMLYVSCSDGYLYAVGP